MSIRNPSFKSKKTRSSSRGATPPPRRQSNRVRKIANTRLPTPASSPPPSSPSRTTTATNTRRSTPQTVTYTTVLPADGGQPTVNWDCVSYVVSDQKIHSTYSKPQPAADPSRPSSYGKLVTKTVTMTVTTTIATTEILHPGEAGYEDSLQRQKTQSPKAEERYGDSRKQAAGNKDAHEAFHACHHRAARPVFTATAAA